MVNLTSRMDNITRSLKIVRKAYAVALNKMTISLKLKKFQPDIKHETSCLPSMFKVLFI